MPSYTVHLPPDAEGEAALERAVFVADRFHFIAFALPPLWMLWYRQWVGLLIYVAFHAQLWLVASNYLPVSALLAIVFLARLWFGFEASSLRRWRLDAYGWHLVDAFAAEDLQDAETRFFERFKEYGGPVSDFDDEVPLAHRTEQESTIAKQYPKVAAAQETKTQRSPVRPAGLPPTGPSVIGY